MNIPKFWARAETDTPLITPGPATGRSRFSWCWGWSNESVEDALRVARERTAAVVQRLNSGARPDKYAYGERPMREDILDTWAHNDAPPFAVITRNTMGCEVLNTADIMFIDVDTPPLKTSASGFLARLFGKTRHADTHGDTH